MKLIYNIKSILCACTVLSVLGLSSCSYLDVVPPEQAGLKDATKNYNSTLAFLYSCFAGIGDTSPFRYSTVEAAADEWVLPPLWNETAHQMTYNLVNATNYGDWRWGTYYRFIGQCHLFLSQLPNAKDITEEQRADFKAMAEFALAYYHMQLLRLYGPIPITDSYAPMNTPANEYKGRYHFDYVVDWLVDKFDDLAQKLPATRESSQWGMPTSTMCKALKARLLLTAASPLWNGSFPYPSWKNTKWETPGYGKELVSQTYSKDKWVLAEQACKEALDFALNNGFKLYDDTELNDRENISLPYVPGVNERTPEGKEFLEKVLMLRYLVATRVTDGNKEIIWGAANQGDIMMGSLPHAILKKNDGTLISGYSGVSPLLNTTISYFYTKDGKRPSMDPNFVDQSKWFKSANISGRPDIINLNVNREPRFYAWFAFDGGDYMDKIANGHPLTIKLRDGNKQGYNPEKFNRDNNVTGWFSQKFIMPKLQYNLDGSNNNESKARPLIRLAELYLSLAECEAELGQTDEAIKNLNIIRERAGVPDLTSADITARMSIVDWVRNERFIELWGEGHRYYDVRRWMIAPETMAKGKRTGLNAYGIVNPTFSQFNEPKPVDQAYEWNNRMYLLPLFNNEVYKNPNLVQAPGYN